MIEAKIRIDTRRPGHRIAPRIYGHFIEHLGRCIYGGVWGEDGPRPDALELAREMRPGVVRWPGGLFADVYHWEDGIGPSNTRPINRNRYWGWFGRRFGPRETNRFGTDEFLDWCARIGAEPYINVNLGTGTPDEAARWVRYCKEGDKRVTLWGIGNEIYGIWARGHTGPKKYGRRYLEFIKVMKSEDPEIQCVAVGTDENYPHWNRRLLDLVGEELSYLSFHVYLPRPEFFLNFLKPVKDTMRAYNAIVASPQVIDRKIAWVERQIAASLGQDHGVMIALDEWNLMWSFWQLLRANWCLRDSLFVASTLHVLQRHKRMGMANYAQMVNVIGAITTDDKEAIATPIHQVFALYSRCAEAFHLPVELKCPSTFANERYGHIPSVENNPAIDAGSSISEEGDRLALTVVNRSWSETARVGLDIVGSNISGEGRVYILTHQDPHARNTFEDPRRVRVRNQTLPEGQSELNVPAHSVVGINAPIIKSNIKMQKLKIGEKA